MKKMFKKTISVISAVVMIITAVPLSDLIGLDFPGMFELTSKASYMFETVTVGDYTYLRLDTEATTVDLYSCNESISGDIVVPSSLNGYQVTSIAANVHSSGFSDCDFLTGVTIPDSVTIIGGMAFNSCNNLTSVTIPDSVTEIGSGAFQHCTSLDNVIIPNSVKEIADETFSGCESLANVTIPNSVTSIGDYAFYFCKNLKNITIPNNVTSIGNSAFGWCGFAGITIPDSVTSIGAYAFDSCKNLKNLIIPNKVTTIGVNAFTWCSSLEYVHIPENVISIGDGALDFASYICSPTEDCYAKTYADSNGIEFKVCNGYHSADNPTDTPTDKTYKIYGRDFKHNLDYFIKNQNSSEYNPELANLLAALSAAAYDEETIKNAYKELGFDDCETFNYDGVTLGKVAYSLAFKKSDNSDETICLVSVRGTVNNSEWLGNANISTTDGKHDGFLNATDQIYDNIQNYIDSNNITGDVKYFVTGHSRGAAVGNLLSVGLMENGVASSDVYNYNYACPDVATKAVFPDYNNIFNVCNTADIVSHVPGKIANSPESDSYWGKYGRTHWFTMDIPDTGDILQDIKNDHNVDFYLKYMDQQLDPSEWWYIAPTDNGVIGHNAKIQCPVDVVITDESDKNIASVINGEINYYDSAFGDVIILTDGDKKFIYINGDNDFNINLVGTDNGKMTYSIEKYNIFTKETLESKTFENVTLEKGKEMYSPVSDAENTDEVKLFVVDDGAITHRITEDGTEIDYSWVNEHVFEMKSPSTATVKYGDTLVLQADLGETALPESWSIRWDVDGAGFNMTPAEDGLTCNMTSVANGNATVKATLVDETGEVVLNVEGNEISAEITLKSNASFWQKIVSFFKNLFRINRIIY